MSRNHNYYFNITLSTNNIILYIEISNAIMKTIYKKLIIKGGEKFEKFK